MGKNELIISQDNTIQEVMDWLANEPAYNSNYFVIAGVDSKYRGILSSSNLYSKHHKADTLIGTLIKRKHISVSIDNSLRTAVEIMAKENIDVLPVVSRENNSVIGILSYQNILSSYKQGIEEHTEKHPHISIKEEV